MSHLLNQRLEKRAATVKRVNSVLWRKGFVKCLRVVVNGRIACEWRSMEHDINFAYNSYVNFDYKRRGSL